MGSSTERVVSPILISPSLNLGEGEGWSVKALGTFFLLHYITWWLFFSPVSFQALRDDVRRQTDRENQLQTRYSNLLYERGATYSQMQHRWKSTLFLLRRFQGMKCLSVEDFLIHLKTQITSDINVHLQITDLKISIKRNFVVIGNLSLGSFNFETIVTLKWQWGVFVELQSQN